MKGVTPELLTLISRVYDGGLSSDQWTGILDEVADYHGAMSSVLFYHDTRHAEFLPGLTQYSSFWNQENLEEYLATVHSEEPSARLLRKSEPRQIITSESISVKDKIRIAGYALKMWRRFGIRALAAARLNETNAWFDYIALQYDSKHGPMKPEQMQSLAILLPHLAKAMEISRPMTLLERRFNAVLEALDRFHIGVVILTERGQKVLANAAAQLILDLRDGIMLDSTGVLRISKTDDHLRFKHALAQANATAHSKGTSCSTLLTVTRGSGRDPYLLEVVPITDIKNDIDKHFRGCILYMIDPAEPRHVSIDGMKEIYRLSDAEVSVCQLLIDGHTNPEMATIRGVSAETIKTQLRSLMNKTGTDNRVHLVRLALSVNLPIDQR
ncbi:MAG: helix-turn-helix transcriptional regulator [Chromatiaceae bacterium]|nr:helix-turn-helix transcriptional regulator [Chromatiaceae bacterium]